MEVLKTTRTGGDGGGGGGGGGSGGSIAVGSRASDSASSSWNSGAGCAAARLTLHTTALRGLGDGVPTEPLRTLRSSPMPLLAVGACSSVIALPLTRRPASLRDPSFEQGVVIGALNDGGTRVADAVATVVVAGAQNFVVAGLVWSDDTRFEARLNGDSDDGVAATPASSSDDSSPSQLLCVLWKHAPTSDATAAAAASAAAAGSRVRTPRPHKVEVYRVTSSAGGRCLRAHLVNDVATLPRVAAALGHAPQRPPFVWWLPPVRSGSGQPRLAVKANGTDVLVLELRRDLGRPGFGVCEEFTSPRPVPHAAVTWTWFGCPGHHGPRAPPRRCLLPVVALSDAEAVVLASSEPASGGDGGGSARASGAAPGLAGARPNPSRVPLRIGGVGSGDELLSLRAVSVDDGDDDSLAAAAGGTFYVGVVKVAVQLRAALDGTSLPVSPPSTSSSLATAGADSDDSAVPLNEIYALFNRQRKRRLRDKKKKRRQQQERVQEHHHQQQQADTDGSAGGAGGGGGEGSRSRGGAGGSKTVDRLDLRGMIGGGGVHPSATLRVAHLFNIRGTASAPSSAAAAAGGAVQSLLGTAAQAHPGVGVGGAGGQQASSSLAAATAAAALAGKPPQHPAPARPPQQLLQRERPVRRKAVARVCVFFAPAPTRIDGGQHHLALHKIAEAPVPGILAPDVLLAATCVAQGRQAGRRPAARGGGGGGGVRRHDVLVFVGSQNSLDGGGQLHAFHGEISVAVAAAAAADGATASAAPPVTSLPGGGGASPPWLLQSHAPPPPSMSSSSSSLPPEAAAATRATEAPAAALPNCTLAPVAGAPRHATAQPHVPKGVVQDRESGRVYSLWMLAKPPRGAVSGSAAGAFFQPHVPSAEGVYHGLVVRSTTVTRLAIASNSSHGGAATAAAASETRVSPAVTVAEGGDQPGATIAAAAAVPAAAAGAPFSRAPGGTGTRTVSPPPGRPRGPLDFPGLLEGLHAAGATTTAAVAATATTATAANTAHYASLTGVGGDDDLVAAARARTIELAVQPPAALGRHRGPLDLTALLDGEHAARATTNAFGDAAGASTGAGSEDAVASARTVRARVLDVLAQRLPASGGSGSGPGAGDGEGGRSSCSSSTTTTAVRSRSNRTDGEHGGAGSRAGGASREGAARGDVAPGIELAMLEFQEQLMASLSELQTVADRQLVAVKRARLRLGLSPPPQPPPPAAPAPCGEGGGGGGGGTCGGDAQVAALRELQTAAARRLALLHDTMRTQQAETRRLIARMAGGSK